MKRVYPDHPVVSVSAAIFHEGKVLLIQRDTEPKKGFWSLPGGAVELGETVEEAVVREISEECDLDVKVVRPVDVRNSIIKDEKNQVKYHYVLINYLCHYLGGEIRICPEVADIRWVDPAEISNYKATDWLADIVAKAAAFVS